MHFRAIDQCFVHISDARWHTRTKLALILGHGPHPALIDEAIYECVADEECNLPAPAASA